MSYCCYIPEATDMSTVRHGVALKRCCVRCIVIEEDIISGEMVVERSVWDTTMIRSVFCKLRRTIHGASRMEVK